MAWEATHEATIGHVGIVAGGHLDSQRAILIQSTCIEGRITGIPRADVRVRHNLAGRDICCAASLAAPMRWVHTIQRG